MSSSSNNLSGTFNRKKHWEQIYQSKKDNEVSWYQDIPKLSLELIRSLKPDKDAAIIDIGGGNSNLVVNLLELGYGNLSVLDISAKALERTQRKLGDRAKLVRWIVSDVLYYESCSQFDLWHDRAAFHFLTKEEEIKQYAATAGKLVKSSGYLIVSAFSCTGPKKCSGLDITQYSEASMRDIFEENFQFIKSLEEVHTTPFGTRQNFIYCIFQGYQPLLK